MTELRLALSQLGIMPEGDPAVTFSRFCQLSEQVDISGRVGLRVHRGREALRIGDYNLAIEDARLVLLHDQADLEAWRLLAKASLANLAVSRGVIPAAPGTADLLIDSHDLERTAREAVRAALEAEPNDVLMKLALDLTEELALQHAVAPFRERLA